MDTLPLVSPDRVGLSAKRLDRVRQWMRRWVDGGRLAGMTVAVMRHGELAAKTESPSAARKLTLGCWSMI